MDGGLTQPWPISHTQNDTLTLSRSMMNGLQALESWQTTFNHPRGGTLGLFNAIQNIGGIVGLPFAPFVSDHFGRRAGMILGAILMIVGTILQTSAQNMAMFIVARALIGCGCSFSAVSSPVLVTELAFPTHRAPLTSLYNSSWYLGSIIAGVSLAFGTGRSHQSFACLAPFG
jgi:MFS family permease